MILIAEDDENEAIASNNMDVINDDDSIDGVIHKDEWQYPQLKLTTT